MVWHSTSSDSELGTQVLTLCVCHQGVTQWSYRVPIFVSDTNTCTLVPTVWVLVAIYLKDVNWCKTGYDYV